MSLVAAQHPQRPRWNWQQDSREANRALASQHLITLSQAAEQLQAEKKLVLDAASSPIGFRKEFECNGETFHASYAAQRWLTEMGFSYGPSSVDGPQGVVMRPDAYIPKWRNMTEDERGALDGTLTASRLGVAVVRLRKPPNE